MENQLIEKIYKISRIVLAVIAFVVFNIMFINEDISWKILPPIFAIIVFGVSFPSSIISKKIINFGNNIKNDMMKILFYIIILPVIIFILFLAIYTFVIFIFENIPTPNEFGAALGQALFALFIVAVGTICVIVPYVQTLIVLILKKFMKK